MEYLKPQLELVASAQDVILGDKIEGSEDSPSNPTGFNKPNEIVGLDD